PQRWPAPMQRGESPWFDKRGTGNSGGDYPSTGFDTEYDDIASALEHLSTVDHVDPQRIGLIGHSVGATMAIRLAASEPAIAAAVLLAGASSPGERVLEWQSDRIGQTLPGPNWLTGRLFRAVQRRSHAKLIDPTTDSITASGVPMSGRWFREYSAYDPTDDLGRITCPVFAITGGKDLQVNPAELAVIASLVNGPCRTQSPADLTHVLRSTTGPPRISHYPKLLDQPVDPRLLASIGDWLTAVLEPT
ncbi:MAG: alpha/beta fold hydrolase, partial [Actinomycetota bacterium]